MSHPTRTQSTGPTAHVDIDSDGTGQVVIDGGAPIDVRGSSLAEGRRLAREAITRAAAVLQRPVEVQTTDPDGQWHLVIYPDGQLAPLEQPGPPPSPAGPARPRPEPDSGTPGPAAAAALRLARPVAAVADGRQAGPRQQGAPQPPAQWTPPGRAEDHLMAIHAQPAPAQQTLADLLAARPAPRPATATWGWRGSVSRLFGRHLRLAPSGPELAHRAAVAAVQRSLTGPRTVVVINPKGGAHKTTATLLISQAFGTHRGGYTLAWDNNESRGTLGWRAEQTRNHTTAVDLLRDLDRFTGTDGRVGDLDNYVRHQGAHFDVLASNEDATLATAIGEQEFSRLHQVLSRFYRLLVIDTGNNMLAPNWRAAVAAADQLVIVSSVREDTGQSAAWLADALVASGLGHKVAEAVTVLGAPARRTDRELHARLGDHFRARTRRVLDVPHDPQLVPGGPIAYDRLSRASQEAWLQVTAAIADGL
jgi:MinD-like ATPase involved in chromosome partitioning or flagellar assembly